MSIKREIGHLCHDEVKPSPSTSTGPGQKDSRDSPITSAGPHQETFTTTGQSTSVSPSLPTYSAPAEQNVPFNAQPLASQNAPVSNWPLPPQASFSYASQSSGTEFSVLTDFLQSLDDRSFFGAPPNILPPPATTELPLVPSNQQMQQAQSNTPVDANQVEVSQMPSVDRQAPVAQRPGSRSPHRDNEPVSPILPAATKAEQFLLTAADQESGSRDERLARVIHSKYEAGLLKPYNYVKGYARLSRWMDRNVSQESKQHILGPLSVLRPKFRAIAQSLTDIDLVFIEEAFERLLLDYDRVFSAMGIPACLWRRTGEIYKGNREFAELVGVEGHMLREGRLCIYELMAEESAVNYWEKYGHVAFDAGQKAVLTSCVLRYKPNITSIPNASSVASSPIALRPGYGNKRGQPATVPSEQGLINCCFSFTIRRDTWGIPSMIVGNFIRH
ncbi:hypothetical protein JB92DRAFT_3045549 [Gautieria morchelliformis]|nr:hypothetical protein JB92DRAFT_3045549 [Gautieria morchelliformis]